MFDLRDQVLVGEGNVYEYKVLIDVSFQGFTERHRRTCYSRAKCTDLPLLRV